MPTYAKVDETVKEIADELLEKFETHAPLLEAGVKANSIPVSGGGKTFQTYTKPGPNGEVYGGRTSGKGTPAQNVAARDANHHMNEKGYGPAVLDKSASAPEPIRGREQQIIEGSGGAQSQGGTSGNAINGISPNNPKKHDYINAANKWFGN